MRTYSDSYNMIAIYILKPLFSFWYIYWVLIKSYLLIIITYSLYISSQTELHNRDSSYNFILLIILGIIIIQDLIIG